MQTNDTPNLRDRSREASQEIRRYVEEGIAAARLRPGDKLPTERELALRYKTGRNTVRRTLVALEEEGRIIRHVGRGTFVQSSNPTSPSYKGLPALASDNALLAAHVARTASPLDLMELRIALEPNTAALAVQRATPAEIERMQRTVEASRTAPTLEEFEALDDDLHRTIALATRNPLIVAIAEMVTTVRSEAEWGTLKKRTLTQELRQAHTAEHIAIVEAIRQREAEAASSAMAEHLRNVKRMMFDR
jgi:DNA-binding FadR family transcriptional regulator